MTRLYFSTAISDKYIGIILGAACCSALMTVGSGYLLNATGDYSGSLIWDHYWAACITTALMWFSMAGFFLVKSYRQFYSIYSITLLATLMGTVYTGHLGGAITHGKEYLTEPLALMSMDRTNNKKKINTDPLIYEDMLAPIFESKCLSCHNAQRAKGGYSMHSYTAVLKSGESGLLSLKPNQGDSSEIYRRVMLPMSHKDHMPPESKLPLTANEISVLKYWIDAGASPDQKIKDLDSSSMFSTIILGLQPSIKKYQQKIELSKIKFKQDQAELELLSSKIGVFCLPDPNAEGNLFALHTRFPSSLFENKRLSSLKPYFDLISSVSLISTDIDDDGLYYIGQMSNLTTLYLQKTKIEGPGLIYLQNLKNLEVLNLSFTKIDDKTAIDFLKFPKLKKVYLYRTNTTKEVAQALSKYKPGLQVIMEEGPYY